MIIEWTYGGGGGGGAAGEWTVEEKKQIRYRLGIDGLTSAPSGNYDISRVLGLTLENHVEDDIVRDSNGNKTSSILYVYNSSTNASLHDKITGLISKYTVTATYDLNNKMTLFKSIKI